MSAEIRTVSTGVDVLQQFSDAIQAAGLRPPIEIIPDGAIHRFAPNGRPTDRAGWYILFVDGIPAGSFGNWRTDKKELWRANIGRTLSAAEEAAHRERVDEIRRKREFEERNRQEEAAQEATALWKSARAATDDHPYLLRKGVKSHGLRVDPLGRLLVPLQHSGELHSLQTIEPDGKKLFLAGGRVGGCYFMVGSEDRAFQDGLLCIAEGYATGATIHEATGHTVVVAFNAGNLLAVAKELRRRFRDLHLVFCADDDEGTDGNPGLSKAQNAASSVSGFVAVPVFGANRAGATDFNDVASQSGLDAVRAAIAKAFPMTINQKVDSMSNQPHQAGGLSIDEDREERAAIMAEATGNGAGGAHAKSTPLASQLPDEELILDPADPLPTARKFVERFHIVAEFRALQHQSGVFFQYDGSANVYGEVEESAIRSQFYKYLESAKRWSESKGARKEELVPFKPTKSKVENTLDALRAVCNLPASAGAPCWLDSHSINPLDIMACRNGLLDMRTRKLLEPSPRFFTLNGVAFDFDSSALEPKAWLRFLAELWPDDPDSIQTLQEWIGYLLTPRTHFQKMLMLVGPKRSGKGTIGRVTRMLLGERNVCGPTLANMAEQFGLSTLIGKSVAIIADARISGRTDTAVITERLLSISGEDTLSVPRKFLPDWNGKLSARFMLMTNELPRIEDASGALSSRFLVLTLSESFYGREDHGLIERFIPELPGILLWALEGWSRLQARGRFNQPESASEIIRQFEDLGSPINAFVRECCEVGRGFEVSLERAFDAWKVWCEENGRERPGTAQVFGKNLRAVVPWLKVTQPRICGTQVRHWEGLRLREVEAR